MATISTEDTMHEDMIHDIQMDYYCKRVATCSSDRTIKIFALTENNKLALQAHLKGHEGPVWQVSWAHPKFGNLLASCSYDRKVFIWKETEKNVWTKLYEYSTSELSVNSVAWAPHEFGPCLACGSSDGTISVIVYKENRWDLQQRFQAHQIGVNAVSWGPAVPPASLVSTSPAAGPSAPSYPLAPKRLVSGGCDNMVKVWRYFEAEGQWRQEEDGKLEGHSDWVRDVSWAPNIGLPSSTIASCSQDGSVCVWTQQGVSGIWERKVLTKFDHAIWRVSWSATGNILAVSGEDNMVSLWKENPDGEWKQISAVDAGTQ